jgi:glycosyltransferase involved in cell wall biosynthesis
VAIITTLMPVFNGMPYLPDALDSILRQSVTDITCIVVDGQSTDGSWEYLQTVKDPRLVLAQCPAGLGRQLTLGLDMCETEIIARMDADDLCSIDRFEKQLAFLRSHENVGMVGTQYAHFAHDPQRKICIPLPVSHAEIYQRLLEGRLALVHPSIMCRTEVLRRAGGYRTAGSGEDWDMFLRVGELSELANLDEVVYSWRLHLSSVTSQNAAHCINRIRFACDSARRRADQKSELSYDEFLQGRSGPLQRILDSQDCYSLLQYRRGLYDLLRARFISGSFRLAWSAACSPTRAIKWLERYTLGLMRQLRGVRT